jgi:hypothetical protein
MTTLPLSFEPLIGKDSDTTVLSKERLTVFAACNFASIRWNNCSASFPFSSWLSAADSVAAHRTAMTVNVIWRMLNRTPFTVELHVSCGRNGTTTLAEGNRSGSFLNPTFAISRSLEPHPGPHNFKAISGSAYNG